MIFLIENLKFAFSKNNVQFFLNKYPIKDKNENASSKIKFHQLSTETFSKATKLVPKRYDITSLIDRYSIVFRKFNLTSSNFRSINNTNKFILTLISLISFYIYPITLIFISSQPDLIIINIIFNHEI